MKVLFLTPWYPHRYDAMSGLFVRKHAQAVASQGVEVGVISMYHEPSITHNEIANEMVNGVREVILYTKKSGITALVCDNIIWLNVLRIKPL